MTAERGLILTPEPGGWLVVDASIVAKWFFEEEHSRQALALTRVPDVLLAPDLLISEVASVFVKKARRGEMRSSSADEALEVIDLFVTLRRAEQLFWPAIRAALEYGRSLYDSLYVALALAEGCRFVTADQRLYNALLPRLGDTMLWIEDVPA